MAYILGFSVEVHDFSTFGLLAQIGPYETQNLCTLLSIVHTSTRTRSTRFGQKFITTT